MTQSYHQEVYMMSATRLPKVIFSLAPRLCLILGLLLAPISTADASPSVAIANQVPTTEQQSAIRAVALVIDGSSSIDEGDFVILGLSTNAFNVGNN